MKIQHVMEHEVDEAGRTIDFELNMKAPGVIDQVGFVVLLAHQFEAEVAHVGQVLKDARYPFGTIELHFPDEERVRAAASFCDENLTESGLTIRAKQADVVHADFRAVEAKELYARLLAAPLAAEEA